MYLIEIWFVRSLALVIELLDCTAAVRIAGDTQAFEEADGRLSVFEKVVERGEMDGVERYMDGLSERSSWLVGYSTPLAGAVFG